MIADGAAYRIFGPIYSGKTDASKSTNILVELRPNFAVWEFAAPIDALWRAAGRI